MLIGSEVNRCFLFFSILSIISDIFFYAVSEPVGVIVFQGLKEGSCFAADRFFAIKYNPEHSGGVEIFCKTRRA
jgi:hypothetical protein